MSDDQQSADEALADEWAAALEEQEGTDGAGDDPVEQAMGAAAEAATFESFKPDGSDTSNGEIHLDSILDVPVTLAMEIGRARINIRNLLQLNQGSVVELDRLAGEPLDVLVNGTLIAQGEVVVVNEKFGIRLTDIVSPSDRVRQLKA